MSTPYNPEWDNEEDEQEVVMLATCGHEDTIGYLTNTPCGKCVRKNHKKALGLKS